MRSIRSSSSLPIALALLLLGGCKDGGRSWLLSKLGLQPCPPVAAEPVPPGARRAASRQEIVATLELARGTTPPPRVVATVEEVVEACPCFVERMKQRQREQERAARERLASGCEPQASCSQRPPTPVPRCGVKLTALTLYVEAEGEILAVTLGDPVQRNGCVYGLVESAVCMTRSEPRERGR